MCVDLEKRDTLMSLSGEKKQLFLEHLNNHCSFACTISILNNFFL